MSSINIIQLMVDSRVQHQEFLDFVSSNNSCLGFCRVQQQVSRLQQFLMLDSESTINIKIELWAQSLHAVNKLGQSTVGHYTLSSMHQYQKLLVCQARFAQPILEITCHMLIMLQPIKSMFFLVYSLM